MYTTEPEVSVKDFGLASSTADDFVTLDTSDTESTTDAENEDFCAASSFDAYDGAVFRPPSVYLSKEYNYVKENVKRNLDEMKLNHYRQVQYLNQLQRSLYHSVERLQEMLKHYPSVEFTKTANLTSTLSNC